jgi:kynureninase
MIFYEGAFMTVAQHAELSTEAEALDAADALAPLRSRFLLPDGVIYLDGNSLGPVPLSVLDELNHVVTQEWAGELIAAWETCEWYQQPLAVGDTIGRLIGAAEGQVVVGESTSVQIFAALSAAVRLRPGRPVLLMDTEQFPTDLYLAQSVARLFDLRLESLGDTAITEEVGVVFASAVDYRSGKLADIAAVTSAAHKAGALVCWDLSHAVGVLPVQCDSWGVDFAVGCTYKYLCGGPGAPAFLYVAARHHSAADPVLTGWHGHAEPFAMSGDYRPAPGITRFRTGTPQLLSLLTLRSALAVYQDLDVRALRAKSVGLCEFFLRCLSLVDPDLALHPVGPSDPRLRGSQVSVSHPAAAPILRALAERRVIADVRRPNLLRFGLSPLIVRYRDVLDAITLLAEIVASDEYSHPRFAASTLMS